ncbi:uncharacterized protein LOC143293727 isoform X2 [Babylonia areolata]|uniref:uncharacterized protein LOC143293727 isoform X2 n=1 Tax=Babylonia areolata TaxID=304850 RepID=UPI003FD0156B
MNRTKQSGIEDTSQDEGVLVPHENNMYLPGPTTLDYSKGQGFEKMVLPDQPQEENNYDWFFTSGLSAVMADQTASLSMLDTAMSWIKNGRGNFGFVFDKRLKVDKSCFEENRHFKKTRDCGKGVSGEVQAYIDRRSQTPFVRKRLKEGKKMRQEEVEMLIRLAHSNIVDVYALLCDGTRVDLLLQDAGHPLRTCLEKFYKEQIAVEKYWPMLKDLTKQGFEALGYMHQQGFAHLDVKPENWLVHLASDRSLVLVLADFGSSVNLNNTMTFSLELTPEYWAPELWNHVEVFLHKRQLSGGGGGQEYYKFSPQACFDTYAMGLCVYYMATLKHLLVRLKERQGTDRPLVPPEDLCQACHNYSIDDSTAFKFLLMKQNSDKLPHWAASGPWLFPGIPPTLLTVIRNTLHPDPKKRWTDEQVTRFLSGKAVDDLKTPTQVDNTSLQSGERGQPENTVPDLQKTPGLAVRVDRVVSGCQLEEPEGLMSSGQQRFQETISPYLKVWDRSTKTSQLEQVIPTTISLQESTSQVTQDDTVAGLDPQAGDAAAAKKPSANCAGNKVMRLSTLVMEEQQMCADGQLCSD